MVEEEAPSGGTEGAVAAVGSANVGTVDVGAVEVVGVDSGGGVPLERAPPVMDEDPPPALPFVVPMVGMMVRCNNKGRAPSLTCSPHECESNQSYKDSVGRHNFGPLQTLLIDSKNGQKSSTVDLASSNGFASCCGWMTSIGGTGPCSLCSESTHGTGA